MENALLPFFKPFLGGSSSLLKTTKQKGTPLKEAQMQVHKTVFEKQILKQMLATKLS